MATDSSVEIAAKLEALRKSFRHKAARELDLFDELLARIADRERARDDRFETVQAMVHLLHRLAGSAGTFGLAELGQEARQLEQSLKHAVEPDQATPAAVNLPAVADEIFSPGFFYRASQLRTRLYDENDEARVAPRHVTDESPVLCSEPTTAVYLCDLPDTVSVFLTHTLNNHGFTVENVSVSALLNLTHEACARAFAVITCEASVASLSGTLKLLQSQYGINLPPLICAGSHHGFGNQYALADQGADALFSEPLDVPMLAERIERLINERSQAVPGKVLILDDDEDLANHYRMVLEASGFDVRAINDPEIVLTALAEFCPDIMLLDVQMGDYSGVTVAKLIRFQPEWLSLPIIYLSSEQDRTVQLEALAQGGDEFMTKPVSDAYLVRAAQVRCYRARQLNQLLIRDSLTGLLKHSVIKQEAEKEHERCSRMGHVSTVAMIDLDHFKQVNDRYGHRTGDHVIKALANFLRHRLRSTDVIGRYGGEEFVVILPECQGHVAVDVLSKICNGFSDIRFATDEGEISVTLSAGVAELNAFRTADGALNAADDALYRQKKAGRNGVTVWQPES